MELPIRLHWRDRIAHLPEPPTGSDRLARGSAGPRVRRARGWRRYSRGVAVGAWYVRGTERFNDAMASDGPHNGGTLAGRPSRHVPGRRPSANERRRPAPQSTIHWRADAGAHASRVETKEWERRGPILRWEHRVPPPACAMAGPLGNTPPTRRLLRPSHTKPGPFNIRRVHLRDRRGADAGARGAARQ
jgi:hypothetical protein